MCQEIASVCFSCKGYTYLTRGIKFISSTALALGTSGGNIVLLNPTDNLSFTNATMNGHSGKQINSMAFNGTTLMSGGLDSCVYFWKVQTSALLGKITFSAVVQFVLLYNSNYLAVATGFSISIVDLNTSRVMQNLTGHAAQVNYLDYIENQLFSTSNDSTVRVWNVLSGSQNGSVNFSTAVFSVLCDGWF
jgi:WD40 repeat protein